MSDSTADDARLTPIESGQLSYGNLPFNDSADDTAGSAQSEDGMDDEINDYVQGLLDRQKQRSSSPNSDPPGQQQATCRKSSTGVTSCLEPRYPESLHDENAATAHLATPPDSNGSVDLLANTVECGPVTCAPPSHNLDGVPAESGTPLNPIRQAPKCDIPAMRDLANSSAHDAIELHDSKQMERHGYVYLSYAAVAACVSAVLYCISPYYLSPPAFVATSILILALVLACRSQHFLRRSHRRFPDSPTTKPTQLQGCKTVL
jgi:hypothetical protein